MAAIDMGPSGAADHLICGHTTYPVPESIVTYCREQTFSFDDAGLLRRGRRSRWLLGGEAAVQYVSGYAEYDGIMVATRRRVYVGNVAGSLTPEEIWMAMDVANFSFT